MNRKQYALISILGIVSGLLGGAIASWFFIGEFVYAQRREEPAKIIKAEHFLVIDKDGKIRASLGLQELPSVARLPSYKGQENLEGAGLFLHSKDDSYMISIEALPDRAGFYIMRQNNLLSVLRVLDGEPDLSLYDRATRRLVPYLP